MSSSHVVIVGGGILGMTLAWRLRREGFDVTLVEGSSSLGGLASPATFDGLTWDRFYHVILASDLSLHGLLKELGLERELRWATTKTGFFTDERLYSLSSSLEFLNFPPLNLIDKVRLAMTISLAARIRDGESLEATLAESWLRRWSGDRVVDRIWLPLLRSKLGENYRQASAAFIWAIIARMYAARRSGLKKEQFGYVTGGYATVLERFQELLETQGVHVLSGSRVTSVEQQDDGVHIGRADASTLHADYAIATIPATKIPALVPTLTAAERERLSSVLYQGIICSSLVLDTPLSPYYVTNITDPGFPFTAVIEMTALVDRATFGGRSLIYLPRYVTQDDPAWDMSDSDVEEASLAGLERMHPHFNRSMVKAFHVSRVRDVLAVSTLHYSKDRMPPVTTSLDRVFLVNSAQIAHGTLNVNETVALAEKAIPALVTRMHPPAQERVHA